MLIVRSLSPYGSEPWTIGEKLLYHPEVAGQRIALPTLLYLLIYNKVSDLALFYTTMAPF